MRRRWRDAVDHMNSLLEQNMRLKSNRPVHIAELRRVAFEGALDAIAKSMTQQPPKREDAAVGDASTLPPSSSDGNDVVGSSKEDTEASLSAPRVSVDMEKSSLARAVDKLLTRITNTVGSDPEVWDTVAIFNHMVNRPSAALDARVKQVRALPWHLVGCTLNFNVTFPSIAKRLIPQNCLNFCASQFRALLLAPGWEKGEGGVAKVAEAATALVGAMNHKADNKVFFVRNDITLRTYDTTNISIP